MDWTQVAALVFGVTVIMVAGAVVLLRPVLRQLTELGATIALRRPAAYATELAAVQEELAQTGQRLTAVETQLHGSDSALCPGSATSRPQAVMRSGYASSRQS